MAGKADFTEDEWKALQQGVMGAGMLVSVAHRDFTDSFGEARAIAADLASHREDPNPLIRDLAGAHGTGFGAFTSPKEVQEGTFAALETGLAALAAKAPDDVAAYRALEVANAAAEAKGGVKPEETAAIEKITAALGAS